MIWKADFIFKLPEGFEALEDEDFLIILYNGKKVGVFTSHATKNEILNFCNEYTKGA